MKDSLKAKTALIIIDVQKGFDEPCWGKRNNPQAEKNIEKLIKEWRNEKRSIIHVHHNSLEENSPLRKNHLGNAVKEFAKPLENEIVFTKNVNSAFIGTKLESYLKEHDFKTLIIVGLTTDHCISTSVRMAGNLGFNVFLVADATATFGKEGPGGKIYSAEQIHEIHLASLNGEFCTVCNTSSIIAK